MWFADSQEEFRLLHLHLLFLTPLGFSELKPAALLQDEIVNGVEIKNTKKSKSTFLAILF